MRIQTSIRVEKEFYEEAKEVFKKLGLSLVAMEKGIPFNLKVPSKELEKRIHNIENNKNVQTYETTKELFDDLGI
jgi:DNA-damage-inducible protein J